MKMYFILVTCMISLRFIAQENSLEDEFYETVTVIPKIEMFWGCIPSGGRINKSYLAFFALSTEKSKEYKIMNYEIQFNGVFFKFFGSVLPEELVKALILAPKKTKVAVIFMVKDQEGINRMTSGVWELK